MVRNKPAGVILFNSDGKMLLGKRSDGKGWATPGGLCKPGEHSIDAAVRELREETGIALKRDDLAHFCTMQVFDESNGVKYHGLSELFYVKEPVNTKPVATTEFSEYVFLAINDVLSSQLRLFMPTEKMLWVHKNDLVDIQNKVMQRGAGIG